MLMTAKRITLGHTTNNAKFTTYNKQDTINNESFTTDDEQLTTNNAERFEKLDGFPIL